MISLRKATEKDKESILGISKTIWDGDDYIPLVVDDWIADKEGEFTVAEIDGKVKGFAKFTVLRPGEYWLEGIRVDSKSRGMGIGKEITKYYIDKAKKKGYKSLALSTYIENYESIKIIEKFGFKKTTAFRFFYKSGEIDLNLSNVKHFEKATEVEEVKYILNSNEIKASNGYLSFDWTFMKATEELLEELINEGSIYVLKEGQNINSTIILSNKKAKGKGLSISYLGGKGYYLDGINFAFSKYLEGGYDWLSFMCPDIQEIKESAYKAGFETFENYQVDVFVYEYV
ncbi:GNAT family N-acetyltransferase [Caloranaerobacter sp. TR13]|uniref:GNAT family N-acetyltransferase n=1 Tax=Caloranaerobacter sp. TR13 TaxID=1302151 RepID=UPI0006D41284|nr:GNAT family N-acetyltransferase [Caloranaerobacter sp. TR13]